MPHSTINILPIINFLSKRIEVAPEEIAFLESVVISKSYKSKELIYKQGDIQKYLGFISKGAVRFYFIDEKGEEHTIEFAFENTAIGQYNGLLGEVKAPANVKALEPTELLGITKDAFLEFLNLYPKYYAVITNLMGIALADHGERNKLLRIPSSRERYEALCELQPEIIKRVALTHIASYLKMALGTLSRVRAGKL